MDVRDWLMAGDPSIRWQVLRDLRGAPESVWRPERARVAVEGWGARLLAHRDPTGRWTPRLYGRKWLSTTYTLLTLRQLGLPPDDARARESSALFLEEALWHDGGIRVTVTQPRSETCVTGFALGLLSYFGVEDPRRERLLEYLLREQLPDGGWNCLRHEGATHSSFHTTANVLDGLRDHGGATEAEARGREFLLAHRLFRSHRTGAVVDPKMLRPTFPPRWRHDVLRALDHFRAAAAPRDPRLADAVEVLRAKRGPDGRWPLWQPHPGAVWFEMERTGRPSRWNTLRALRVLEWFDEPPGRDSDARRLDVGTS
ncbi:hypothetical protein GCM10010492_58160 [Saccharothrix mutabilis subsp. mutabilis]|uniref:Uncharacterized protein n=1 Tax=Saccharothrix mutabilis subsp. mutabilis TaxID=66855 RepID=A0ABN0UH72_9PSEU